MKAVEVTGSVDEQGNLKIDEPISGMTNQSKVRVIVLFPEAIEETDPDDTSIEEVKASLKRALQEAKAGQRIPISQMWEGIDVD
jgi:F0F1-type ATP synthase epsilon subunit